MRSQSPIEVVSKEFVGKGAFGSVYKVVDSEGRIYAVKEIQKDKYDPGEIEMLSQLSHAPECSKHVMCYIDIDEEGDDNIELWFEYLGGGSLDDFIEQYKYKQTSDYYITIDRIVRELLEAVRYIHSRGVTHRDIKPENVMITREGDVKLIDFGIACKGCEQRGSYPGSFAYIPPTIYRKKDADELITSEDMKRHDVFSVGYVLLMLLTRGFWPVRSVFTLGDPFDAQSVYGDLVNTEHFKLPADGSADYLAWLAALLVSEQITDVDDALDALTNREAPARPAPKEVEEEQEKRPFKRPKGPPRRARK